MACTLTDPLGCAGDLIGGAVSSAASSAWTAICKDFASAAASLLDSFAKAFVGIPNVDLASGGVKSVYGMSMGIAAFVAALLMFVQIIRTAVTHDGSALAQCVVGLGKAVLAFLLTLVIAGTALTAADELSRFIIIQTFGSTQALSNKIAKLVSWNPSMSASLLLIFAVLGILLTVVLWFELLLRNAAIAVLVATSPIAASGQVSDATKGWWSKMVAAVIQLIILKPIIALVFALGFAMTGDSQDVESMLVGMLVLLMAAVAWPAVARFFSFASVQVGGGAGLGALLGFAAGQLASGGGGGAPTGTSPEKFGQESAARTSAAMASKEGASSYAAPGSAAGGASGGAPAGAAGAAKAAGAAAGPAGIALAAVSMAQRGANALTGRMEQMAGHAGIAGANPYAQPAGRAGNHPVPRRSKSSGGDAERSTADAEQVNAANPQAPAEPAAEHSPPRDPGPVEATAEPGRVSEPPAPEPPASQSQNSTVQASEPLSTGPPTSGSQNTPTPPAAAPHSDPPTIEMPAVIPLAMNKRPDLPHRDDFTEAT